MRLTVNGKTVEAGHGTKLSDFLKSRDMDPRMVAVELNNEIVKRGLFEDVALKDGDTLEIVMMVGGGSKGAKALVIVESPAKSRTLSKFLGSGYKITSSMGHIKDLPKKKMGIDVENGFNPEYVSITGRKKVITALKKDAKNSDPIYVAADPDREGEAISWHVAKAVQTKGKHVYRVSFNEITSSAVKEAFKHPRSINMSMVSAQQARRVMDRIVGYSLSPLLWKKVGKGLSAGRVQSVAVKIIVDREKEIDAFKPDEYWKIEAELRKSLEKGFKAELAKIDDKNPEIKDEKSVKGIVEDIKKKEFIVHDIRKQQKQRSPYAPFTTSTLQQEAFNKLRFSANKTMRIAQMLYEGLDLGEKGPVGLITYMRTDSVRISDTARKEAVDYIKARFGDKFLPSKPNVYKSKKGSQEAHEAIRPTYAGMDPDSITSYLTQDQHKLYGLIWRRFLASQMAKAVTATATIDIKAGRYLFRASDTEMLFKGFTALYEEESKDTKLPVLKKDERLTLVRLDQSQHFTKAPARFSDASLVKALEENGIGRPSTYAPIIETIIFRRYVRREAGYLYPTDLGKVVVELLVKHFPVIIDEEFTAAMEEELDKIEEDKADYVNTLKTFYDPFMKMMEKAKVSMRDVKKEVIHTDEICGKCERPMVIKWGRRGKFLSCSGFPKCDNAKSITTGAKCPQADCAGELVERHSRRGYFYGCTNYPKCTFTSNRLPSSEKKEEKAETSG
ncbi:MAG: hypothetical protein AUJ75_00225 [Candidatus Omnitrophica bacterium CG1_02_49_10]|nr:MAG: hypothetical protein AUJ75_00225 [Candidatus Omnitrophica bacterium CG1_02_49_10]